MKIRLLTRKVIISILAALSIVLVALGLSTLNNSVTQPVTASAEDTYTTVSTADGLSSLTTGTYKLDADITLSSTLTIAENTTVTIDLNGHTLGFADDAYSQCYYCEITSVGTSATTIYYNYYYSVIVNKGNLIITDTGSNGSITGIGTYSSTKTTDTDYIYYNKKYFAVVYNEGIFSLDGGSITAPLTNYAYGIYNDGTATISGGKITAADAYSYGLYNTATAEMSGGKIELTGGNSRCIDGTGTLKVTGGNITAKYAGIYLTGGSAEISEITIEEAGTYGIYVEAASVTVTSSTINSAKNGVYLKSNSEASITNTKITTTGTSTSYAVYVAGGSKLTVNDNTEIKASQYGIYGDTSADITINGGSVVAGTLYAVGGRSLSDESSVNITINGGSFSSSQPNNQVLYGNGSVNFTITAITNYTDNDGLALFLIGTAYYKSTTATINNSVTITVSCPTTGYTVESITFSEDNSKIYYVELSEGYRYACIVDEDVTNYYRSLGEAVSDAEDGETVILLKDTSMTTSLTVVSKSITIDCNGCNIQCFSTNSFLTVNRNVKVTLKNSTGTSSTITYTGTDNAIEVWYNGILELNDNVKISASNGNGVLVWGEKNQYETFIMYGGEIEAGGCAVIGNGSNPYNYTNDDGEVTYSQYVGYTKIYIYAGTLMSTGACAIYHPQLQGELYLYGGTITGITGVEIRGGTVVIDDNADGTALLYINGNTGSANADINTSGSTTSGMAIAIVPYSSHPLDVTISSGTFTGYYSIYENNVNGYSSSSLPTIEIEVTGGTFTGNVTANNVADSSDYVLTVSGGTFSDSSVSSYVTATSIISSDSSTYSVTAYDVKLTAGSEEYGYNDGETSALAQALAAATSSGTSYTLALADDYEIQSGEYKLSADITLASALTIPSSAEVTIDLNSHKLSYDGSASTYTLRTTRSTSQDSSDATKYYTYIYNYNTGIVNNGTLIIKDSVGTGSITNTATETYTTSTETDDTANTTTTTYTYYRYVGLSNYGTLTIYSGTVSAYYTIFNYGVMNMAGGTVSSGRYGIYNLSSGILTINDGCVVDAAYIGVYMYSGTTTINGGKIDGTYWAVYTDGGTLYVNDGTITASVYYGVRTAGTTYIAGGTITGTWGVAQTGGDLTISDGTIIGVSSAAETNAIGVWNTSGTTMYITGGTIEATQDYYYSYGAVANGTIIISGDTVITSSSACTDAIWVYGVNVNSTGSLIVSDDVEITATYTGNGSGGALGIGYWGLGNKVAGAEENPVTVVVNGGTIYGSTYGISGNGSYSYSDVTITGGDIEGGVVGYYHPEMGKLNISGGSITGKYAGLQICAGTINITGGTFTATATAEEIEENANNTSNKSGDGIIADGAAISIINRDGYGLAGSSSTTTSFDDSAITITGGTFISSSGIDAVQAYSYDSDAESKVTALETDESDPQTIVTVTGGTFSSALSGQYSSYLVADGLATTEQNEDGTYGITIATETDSETGEAITYAVAIYLDGSATVAATYQTLEEAFAAINSSKVNGTTITGSTSITVTIYESISECTSITLNSGKNVTINLNGNTIEFVLGAALTNKGTLAITGTGEIIFNHCDNIGIINSGSLTTASTATVTINPVEITLTEPEKNSFTYNGDAVSINGITGVKTVDGSAATITYTYNGTNYTDLAGIKLVNAGTYTITYTVTAENHSTATGSITVVIDKYTVTAPEADSNSYTYTGEDITYKLVAGDGYTISDNLTQKSAGTYTITVSLTDKTNYVWADGSTTDRTYTFTIAKATITAPEADDTTYTYTGSAITYQLIAGDGYTITGVTSATEVGTYTITVTLDDTTDYVWSDGGTAAKTYVFTIAKATNELTGTLTMSGWTYGGTASAPSGVSAAYGTVTYLYSDSENGTYTATQPTAAGTYYVMAYVAGTDNYAEVYGSAKAFTIAKGTYDMSGVKLSDVAVVYDGTERSIVIAGTLPDGVAVTYTGNGQTNVGTYTITASFTGSSNYNSIASLTATLTISNAAMTVTASGYSGIYDGSAHTGSVSAATVDGAAYTVAYGTAAGTYNLDTIPSYKAAGTYTVYYQVTAANHETVTGSVVITIETSVTVNENNTVSGGVTSASGFVGEEVSIEMNLVEEKDYAASATTIASAVVNAVEEVAEAEVVAVYEVTLTSNNDEITVSQATNGGTISVTVAIPTGLAGQSFYIVHIHNGAIVNVFTDSHYTVESGYVTFETDSLSQFAFVSGSEASSADVTESTEIATEQLVSIILVVGTLAAVLLVVVVIGMACTRKKRRH